MKKESYPIVLLMCEDAGLVTTLWSSLRCVLGPLVPSALGTKEGNLVCHNMARGLSTPHLFV